MKKTYLFLALLLLTIASWIVWLRLGNVMSDALSTALCIWNWLLGPIVVVVMAQFAKEELDFEDPQGPPWKLVRILVGTPMGCFGITGIVVGVGLMAFALWHLVVEREADAITFLSAFGVLAAGVALGGRMIVRAFRRTGPTRQEIEEREQLRNTRLENPDWDLFEQHLGRPVPSLLRENYFREEEFHVRIPDGEDLDLVWSPIHPSEILPLEETGADCDLFPFAWDRTGGFVFLMPGADLPDSIYLADIEVGNRFYQLFLTPEEFFGAAEPILP